MSKSSKSINKLLGRYSGEAHLISPNDKLSRKVWYLKVWEDNEDSTLKMRINTTFDDSTTHKTEFILSPEECGDGYVVVAPHDPSLSHCNIRLCEFTEHGCEMVDHTNTGTTIFLMTVTHHNEIRQIYTLTAITKKGKTDVVNISLQYYKDGHIVATEMGSLSDVNMLANKGAIVISSPKDTDNMNRKEIKVEEVTMEDN